MAYERRSKHLRAALTFCIGIGDDDYLGRPMVPHEINAESDASITVWAADALESEVQAGSYVTWAFTHQEQTACVQVIGNEETLAATFHTVLETVGTAQADAADATDLIHHRKSVVSAVPPDSLASEASRRDGEIQRQCVYAVGISRLGVLVGQCSKVATRFAGHVDGPASAPMRPRSGVAKPM